MNVKKLILPMMAMIFAVGLTFATVNPEQQPDLQKNDYILLNGTTWLSIPEQPCQNGQFTCQVQDGENGPVYEVYDEMDDEKPKNSPSDDPIIIEL